MNLYAGDSAESDDLMTEINTTPLVDVMLVLLIIFLLTIPVVSNSINVKLPAEAGRVHQSTAEHIIMTVDAAGTVYYNQTPISDPSQLLAQFQTLALAQPQPEVHIRADAAVPYAFVGVVVDLAQQAGFAKVGLITEPGTDTGAASSATK
jgi:biopolymer transport protein ExbD